MSIGKLHFSRNRTAEDFTRPFPASRLCLAANSKHRLPPTPPLKYHYIMVIIPCTLKDLPEIQIDARAIIFEPPLAYEGIAIAFLTRVVSVAISVLIILIQRAYAEFGIAKVVPVSHLLCRKATMARHDHNAI